jgi:N-acetylmuramoyl-L-alanine amidase
MMRTIPWPSPNFGARRGGVLPDMVVIHYTGMTDCAGALARLCDPQAQVSAHYLISEAGEVFALVDEAMRAWHAGAGGWGAVRDVNSRSLGIELANTGTAPFPEAQMAALESLLAGIMARWSVPPERVIGHADMAPERKHDPGPVVRLAQAGVRRVGRLAGQGGAGGGRCGGLPRPRPRLRLSRGRHRKAAGGVPRAVPPRCLRPARRDRRGAGGRSGAALPR